MRDADPRTLDRARRGDPTAFEQLVREYQADVYRFAWHLTRDRELAADVTQDAFLRAFRFLDGFRGDRKFGSWLFSITRNCAMDSLRARRFPLVHDGDREVEGAVVEVFGLSYREAADVLAVAPGTVKSRMFRARQALCAAIAEDEPGASREVAADGPGEGWRR